MYAAARWDISRGAVFCRTAGARGVLALAACFWLTWQLCVLNVYAVGVLCLLSAAGFLADVLWRRSVPAPMVQSLCVELPAQVCFPWCLTASALLRCFRVHKCATTACLPATKSCTQVTSSRYRSVGLHAAKGAPVQRLSMLRYRAVPFRLIPCCGGLLKRVYMLGFSPCCSEHPCTAVRCLPYMELNWPEGDYTQFMAVAVFNFLQPIVRRRDSAQGLHFI